MWEVFLALVAVKGKPPDVDFYMPPNVELRLVILATLHTGPNFLPFFYKIINLPVQTIHIISGGFIKTVSADIGVDNGSGRCTSYFIMLSTNSP